MVMSRGPVVGINKTGSGQNDIEASNVSFM